MNTLCRNEKKTPAALFCYNGMGGFSLAELIVAMAIGLVIIGAAYSLITIQNKTLSTQEQIVEMQQNVRSAMDLMTREVRLAGYNPGNTAFDGITVNDSQLEVKAEFDDPPNTSLSGEEDIIYAYDSANKRITRNIGAGNQPFAENIEAFTFQYLDASGNVTALNAGVRMVRIAITGRTAQPDPSYTLNNGYRTYTLTSNVTPRNLAFERGE